MSWCLECKNEYREGFTICSDCESKLVEALAITKDIVHTHKYTKILRIVFTKV